MNDPDFIDDADLYARVTIPPHIKRRADAEWEASDEFGRLPKDWVLPTGDDA